MRMGLIRSILPAITILASIAVPGPARSQDIVEQAMRIPMAAAGSDGLEAVMVRPNDSAAHPLAVLNHGSPRNSDQRPGMTAWQLMPQAREFARRGWTTVMVLRRGFGSSGGGFREDARSCSSHPEYYASGQEAAQDLRAAITYLSTLAQVDASRIISVGVSAGGFATVALSADPPPGLIAAISFAGGRGSDKPDEVCNPDDLIRAFSQFGRTSRIPMLWVYADNDHFFGPRIAAQFYQAFTGAGGSATLVRAAAFRTDGHGLFSLAGIPLWTPLVDNFLAAQHLKLRETLLSLPPAPDVSAPFQLSVQGREEFRAFLTLPAHKAFAVSSGGHYGYSFGRRTGKEAWRMAEDHCSELAGRGNRCTVVYSDEKTPGD
jgi:dienelactone hydrolase